MHKYEEPLHIKWIHFAKSRQDLGYNATRDYYQDILKKCHPMNRKRVEEKLQNAKKCKWKSF